MVNAWVQTRTLQLYSRVYTIFIKWIQISGDYSVKLKDENKSIANLMHLQI